MPDPGSPASPVPDPGSRGLVLVVEDEAAIADLIGMYLTRAGFGVAYARDGITGLSAAQQRRPAAIILDVGLPGIDGTEVCRRLRAAGDWTPVLFCTARDDEVDRVLGLELGADDYITKPFSPRELVARVKAVARRAAAPAPARDRAVVGTLTIDRDARRVWVSDREVTLTTTEFDLLSHLATRPGSVFTRDELLREVWGYAESVGTRTVDVHIAQLRAKLGDDSQIRTVRGVGYALRDPARET